MTQTLDKSIEQHATMCIDNSETFWSMSALKLRRDYLSVNYQM